MICGGEGGLDHTGPSAFSGCGNNYDYAFGTSNAASVVNDIATGLRWEFNQMKQKEGEEWPKIKTD